MITAKTISMLIYTVFWSFLFCAGIYVIPILFPSINGNDSYNLIADFDRSVLALDTASDHKDVLIGSSSTDWLGQFAPFINLSISAANPQEIRLAAETFCDPHDKIFFGVTKGDIARVADAPRPMVVSNFATWSRKENCLRELILGILSGNERKPLLTPFPGDREIIEAATGCKTYSDESIVLISFLTRQYADAPIDIAFLGQFCKDFPNATIVALPSLPFQPVSPDSLLGEAINRYIASQKAFISSLHASGLPLIDLSELLPADQCYDPVHANDRGRETLRAALISCCSPPQYSFRY